MLEHDIVNTDGWLVGRLMGRREIFTPVPEITAANVVEVLEAALPKHQKNRDEIEYLYRYLKGYQPILNRKKEVREEICNKIVVNRANQIVTFKTANFIGEPLQYVSRGTDASVPEQIEKLNSFMMSENKSSKDMKLAYWMFTCGVGYRMVLRDKANDYIGGDLYDEAPFEIYTLDPRTTFVIRSTDVSRRILAGVTYVSDEGTGNPLYTVYTRNRTFYIGYDGGHTIRNDVKHNFGAIPIIEYPCNDLRMGAFEIVLDLLDAINLTESDRLDGIEQFIQALMVFKNVDISREEFLELRDLGAIKLPSRDGMDTDLFYLNEQLDQTQTQTLIEDMWQTVLEIVGMPSQGNANTADSSNNGAVIMKNGWGNAEARAKETDEHWKESETDFLKIILKICRDVGAFDLRISQIDQKFGRRSYEDLLTKVQAFTMAVGAGCPVLEAAKITNIATDAESFALAWKKNAEEEEKATLEQLALESEHRTETIVTSNNETDS